MELSPHMALLHDRHFQDILPHVDGEAVVPFRDAHLAVVRPEDVRVDPVELGVGEYDTAFKCQVWGSYDCVVKIPNNNVLKDWHPTSTRLKQRGAAEYVPLLSVATYSITPAFCSGFETEFRVAKRLFEPFPSSSGQHAIEEARHMALVYSRKQAHPGFPHAHRILRVELEDERLPMLFSERCDTTAHTLSRQRLYPNCASRAWRDMARQILLGFDYLLWRGVVHLDLHSDNMYGTRRADGTYHYHVADYNHCMVMDGQNEERWHADARQAFVKMKIHLFLPSSGMTSNERNYESWLSTRDKDRVPDDAAFERRYQEFLAWVSGDDADPPALYFYPLAK